MNKSVRGHADEGCQNGAPLTAQALQPAAADTNTVAPRSGPREAACTLGQVSTSRGGFSGLAGVNIVLSLMGMTRHILRC